MSQICEVLKYEGDNSTFIWKHPEEDFNSLTQLIVHETQEAIFFLNGQALDTFPKGRHTLETQNTPKLSRILNRTTGDVSPFHCEVYFINLTEQMAIKWGTDSQVLYEDPVYHFQLSIGACGEMSLKVENGRKLLLKLVGTESSLTQSRLIDYFRAVLMTKVKSYIAQTIVKNNISIFQIDSRIDEFSNELKKLLEPDFLEYGVSLERFFVTSVLKPDGDRQYERFKDLHFRQVIDPQEAELKNKIKVMDAQAAATQEVIASQARATARAQEGYTYQQERGFDVMGDIARNEGSGSDLRNAAMGIGMGFGVGGAFGNAVNGIANGTMNGLMEPVKVPGQESSDIPGMINLKSEVSEPNTSRNGSKMSMEDFKESVEKLKIMHDAGLIDEDEFAEQKRQLMNDLRR